MEKNFFFELITPSKNLISGEFDMVVVPGEEGDFGVLPSHSNLISQIRPGVLDTYKNNKIDKSFFIYNGFAEVSNNFDSELGRSATIKPSIPASAASSQNVLIPFANIGL